MDQQKQTKETPLGTFRSHCGKIIKLGKRCCDNPCCYACPYTVEELELFDAGREACEKRMRESTISVSEFIKNKN